MVGPYVEKAGPALLEAATDDRPETFSRRARDWVQP